MSIHCLRAKEAEIKTDNVFYTEVMPEMGHYIGKFAHDGEEKEVES